ncbi:MAG TPA: M14 family metallopeptidase [Gemmatimonadaceae bacterium]|nr:M14 family metallopeptidase [Gemmatimonadaceae bacterium]
MGCRVRIRPYLASLLALLAVACAPAAVPPAMSTTAAPRASPTLPRTRAERTEYRETSSYEDVMTFIDSLRLRGAPIVISTIGKTTEGRDIPLVRVDRVSDSRAPGRARRHQQPVVYVQANIHAGEVEGKEAMQALIRDLAFAPSPSVLDSIVLLVAPIYNADGNERLAAQSVNRPEQNGPERVGERANAQRLDLNRDYIKTEAPETLASLEMIRAWNPDVFVDLHATNGSYHGYALTYAPSLSPAAIVTGPYTRDTLLPAVRERLRARHNFEAFDYGNFVADDDPAKGWTTYDGRPRFGTNYIGVRGRIGVLSEAYSHDPFERRVKSTYAFVRELLSYVAEHAAEILALSESADRSAIEWGQRPSRAPEIPLRSRLTTNPERGSILVERTERTGDSTRREAGLPPGVRRSGSIAPTDMPLYLRFEPTLTRPLPYAYVLVQPPEAVVQRLRVHGIATRTLAHEWSARVERFRVDSIHREERLFQGHNEIRLEGRWLAERRRLPKGSVVVPAAQPLAVLAAYLLEPESDDGLATWNFFDRSLSPGGEFPVLKLAEPLAEFRVEAP